MKLTQPYIPESPVCVMCGDPSVGETCSDKCGNRLLNLRGVIDERIADEKSGVKFFNEKTIRDFNRIQDIIG